MRLEPLGLAGAHQCILSVWRNGSPQPEYDNNDIYDERLPSARDP
jgi:hypothetical protein